MLGERQGARTGAQGARRSVRPQGCSSRSWAPRAPAGCCWVSAPQTPPGSWDLFPTPHPAPCFPAPFPRRGPGPRTGPAAGRCRPGPSRTTSGPVVPLPPLPPCPSVKGISNALKGKGRREHSRQRWAGDIPLHACGSSAGTMRCCCSATEQARLKVHYIISLKPSCLFVQLAHLWQIRKGALIVVGMLNRAVRLDMCVCSGISAVGQVVIESYCFVGRR